jgi:DNA transposition AAA+ family ATPase
VAVVSPAKKGEEVLKFFEANKAQLVKQVVLEAGERQLRGVITPEGGVGFTQMYQEYCEKVTK